MKTLNVAIIGYKFMGKAHSNAWKNAPRFFDMNIQPILKVACGRNEDPLRARSRLWEFKSPWGPEPAASFRRCQVRGKFGSTIHDCK